jgi:hypothetical protein
LIAINSSEVRGEDGTGFEKRGDRGPFQCGNCNYFEDGTCHQRTMMKVSKQPKEGEYPKVAAEDCCEYISRKAKVF